MDGYDYVVQLVDQISGPAKTARQQIDTLTSGLSTNAKEAAELKAVYDELRSSGSLSAAQEKDITTALDKSTKSMDQQAKKIRDLVTEEQQKIKADHEEAAAQAQAGQEAAGFNETLEASMAYLVAFAAIVAAVVVVLGGLFLGGAKLALDASQFKSQSTIALQAVVGTSQAAASTYKEIEGISDSIGISNERAQSLGLSLLNAGVKQNQLGDAIAGIGELEKVRGADAANKLQNIIEKSAVTGKLSFNAKSFAGTGVKEADLVAALAKNLKTAPATIKAELEKGKISATDGTKAINDVLKNQLGDASGFTSFGDAIAKIQEKFTRLFEDVNTKPFLAALKEISTWFDASTVQGAAMKWLFETIFNTAFAEAQRVLPYIKIGFLEIVIVALKIYIAMKPVIASFENLGKQLGIAGQGGDILATVIVDLIDAAGEFVIIFVTGIEYIIDLVTLLVAWFEIGESAVSKLAAVIESEFAAALAELKSIFSPASGGSLADDLINGFVNGITGGVPKAVAAMSNLGQGAIAAIRNVLGTHSPSTEMANVGHDTVDGFDNAVDSRADSTNAKLANVVTPPTASGGSGGGGGQIVISPGAVVVSVGAGAGGASPSVADIQSAVEAALAEMAESIIMQLGGAGAPGTST